MTARRRPGADVQAPALSPDEQQRVATLVETADRVSVVLSMQFRGEIGFSNLTKV